MLKSPNWLYVLFIALLLSINIPLYATTAENYHLKEPKNRELTTLTHDVIADPDSLDPATSYTGEGWRVIQNIYDTLVTYSGESTELVPGLAESWNVSEDGKTYTFKIRNNAVFSNGNPCNASAVKYSIDRVIKMRQPPSWILRQVLNESSTQIIDQYTVQINLTFPYSAFLACLACPVASVIDPIYVEQYGGVSTDEQNPWMNEHPMGTGPYRLVEWTSLQRIVLEKNENYWGGWAGRHMDRVILQYMPNYLTRMMRIEKGDSDYTSIPAEHINETAGKPGIVLETGKPTFIITYAIMNCYPGKHPPLDNPKVRQAISYAVDYEQILQEAVCNYGMRFQGPVPKGMFGYNDSIEPYERNLTKARALLEDAGYSNGFQTRLAFGPDTTQAKIAEYLRDQLLDVNIVVDLEQYDWSYLLARLDNGLEPMALLVWMPDYIDPDDYAYPFLHSSNFGKAGNFAFFSNATGDELIMNAKQELNLTLREELYSEIQALTKEQAPYLWLYQASTLGVRRDWLKGYTYNPARMIEYRLFHKAYTPDYASIRLTASPASLFVNNIFNTSSINVTFVNVTGAPIQDATVTFRLEQGSGRLSANTSTTDSYGRASVTYIAGFTSGEVIIKAFIDDVWNTTELTLLTYTQEYASLKLTCEPASISADGLSTSVINAWFLNITGAPISGAIIKFRIQQGSGELSSATSITDANGNASVIYTSSVISGKVIINASIDTVWNTTELILTPREPAELWIKAPSTVYKNSSSTITVTVVDELDRSISDIVVNFSLEYSIGGWLNTTTSTTDDAGKVRITYHASPVIGYEIINISAGEIWELLNITIVAYLPDISILAPEGMLPGGLVYFEEKLLINTPQNFTIRLYNLNYSVSTTITIWVNITDATGTTTLELEETEDYTVIAPDKIQILIPQGNYTEIVLKPYKFRGLDKANISVCILPELDANPENNGPLFYELELLVSDISIAEPGGLIAPADSVTLGEPYQLVVRLYNLNYSAPANLKVYINVTDANGTRTLGIAESENYTIIASNELFVLIETDKWIDIITENCSFEGDMVNISIEIKPDFDTNYENNGPRYWKLSITVKTVKPPTPTKLPTGLVILSAIIAVVIVSVAALKLLLRKR